MTINNTLPHPASRELLDDAHALGWAIMQHGAGRKGGVSYRITSPINPGITIDIPPIRQWNDDKLRGLQDKLRRYSDPDKVEILDRYKIQEDASRAADIRAQQNAALEAAQRRADAAAAKVASSDTPATTPKPGPPAGRPKLEFVKSPEESTVVHQEPWFARVSSGTNGVIGYPSKTVIQRTWSNDTVDFLCAGCGEYSHEKPWSVTAHYARTSNDKHPHLGPRRPEDLVEVRDYVSYTPRVTKPRLTTKDVTMPTDSVQDAAVILEQVRALVAVPDDTGARLLSRIEELETELLEALEARDQALSEVAKVRAAFSVLTGQ